MHGPRLLGKELRAREGEHRGDLLARALARELAVRSEAHAQLIRLGRWRGNLALTRHPHDHGASAGLLIIQCRIARSCAASGDHEEPAPHLVENRVLLGE